MIRHSSLLTWTLAFGLYSTGTVYHNPIGVQCGATLASGIEPQAASSDLLSWQSAFIDSEAKTHLSTPTPTDAIHAASLLTSHGYEITAGLFLRDYLARHPSENIPDSLLEHILFLQKKWGLALLPPQWTQGDLSHLTEAFRDELTFQKGLSLFHSKQWDTAEKTLKTVSEHSIFYNRSQFILGALATQQGRLSEADSFFSGLFVPRVYTQSSEFWSSNLNVSNPAQAGVEVHIGPSQLADAESVALLGILELARVAYAEGQRDRALTLYEKIPATSPHYGESLIEQAWTHLQLGNYVQAEQNSKQAHQVTPGVESLAALDLTALIQVWHDQDPTEFLNLFYARARRFLQSLKQPLSEDGPGVSELSIHLQANTHYQFLLQQLQSAQKEYSSLKNEFKNQSSFKPLSQSLQLYRDSLQKQKKDTESTEQQALQKQVSQLLSWGHTIEAEYYLTRSHEYPSNADTFVTNGLKAAAALTLAENESGEKNLQLLFSHAKILWQLADTESHLSESLRKNSQTQALHLALETLQDTSWDHYRDALFFVGAVENQLGQTKAAQKHLAAFVSSPLPHPQRAEAEVLLGDLAFSQKDYDEAKRHFTHVLHFPDSPLVGYSNYKYGWCEALTGNLDGALDNMRQALLWMQAPEHAQSVAPDFSTQVQADWIQFLAQLENPNDAWTQLKMVHAELLMGAQLAEAYAKRGDYPRAETIEEYNIAAADTGAAQRQALLRRLSDFEIDQKWSEGIQSLFSVDGPLVQGKDATRADSAWSAEAWSTVAQFGEQASQHALLVRTATALSEASKLLRALLPHLTSLEQRSKLMPLQATLLEQQKLYGEAALTWSSLLETLPPQSAKRLSLLEECLHLLEQALAENAKHDRYRREAKRLSEDYLRLVHELGRPQTETQRRIEILLANLHFEDREWGEALSQLQALIPLPQAADLVSQNALRLLNQASQSTAPGEELLTHLAHWAQDRNAPWENRAGKKRSPTTLNRTLHDIEMQSLWNAALLSKDVTFLCQTASRMGQLHSPLQHVISLYGKCFDQAQVHNDGTQTLSAAHALLGLAEQKLDSVSYPWILHIAAWYFNNGDYTEAWNIYHWLTVHTGLNRSWASLDTVHTMEVELGRALGTHAPEPESFSSQWIAQALNFCAKPLSPQFDLRSRIEKGGQNLLTLVRHADSLTRSDSTNQHDKIEIWCTESQLYQCYAQAVLALSAYGIPGLKEALDKVAQPLLEQATHYTQTCLGETRSNAHLGPASYAVLISDGDHHPQLNSILKAVHSVSCFTANATPPKTTEADLLLLHHSGKGTPDTWFSLARLRAEKSWPLANLTASEGLKRYPQVKNLLSLLGCSLAYENSNPTQALAAFEEARKLGSLKAQWNELKFYAERGDEEHATLLWKKLQNTQQPDHF